MAREYFCAYHSYLKAMRNLSDAECGRLFRALLQYSAGETLINLQGREGVAFDFMTEQIDRDNAAYEEKCKKNSDNVKKRYDRKQTNTNEYDRIESNTTVYETYQDKGKGEGEGKDKGERSFLAETRKEPKEFPASSRAQEKTLLVALGCGKTPAPPTPVGEVVRSGARASPERADRWDYERQRWVMDGG